VKALRLFALAVCLLASVSAQHVGVPTTDLDKVSVDELFSVEVTSVGRKAQQLAKAPAAVFVLTAADIHRSGATSIPELLQLVPGLTVLQLDGRNWVVSARGGARLYADKMLVMIDGRSVFTRLFSGVIWDTVDVPLDDIEQIEVVRGAGAVMWGPNALNGVIDIVTRNSRTTTGGETTVATGNDLALSTEARWGAAPNSKISYRLWGKFDFLDPDNGSPAYFVLPNQLALEPLIGNLNSATGRVGVRVDGQPDEADQWMMQGDLYKTDRQDPVESAAPYPAMYAEKEGHTDYLGGYVQGRWVHSSPDGSERTLQFSYDRSGLDYPNTGGVLNSLNVNYEWRRQTSERNEIYWGAGYEQYWDKTIPGRETSFTPANSTYEVGDTVVRDEWQFIPGKLMGSVGVRFDYNSFHQLEYQPSVRLLFTPDTRQSWWAAASRAVRAPNRVDRDFDQNAGVESLGGYPLQLWLYGSTSMKSEVERTLETGYRYQSGQRWSVDASIFWSYYERLRAVVTAPTPSLSFPNGSPLLSSSGTFCNGGTGRSYGGEIWGTWQVRTGWKISPSYSYLNEARWLPSSPYYNYLWDGTPATLAHQGILRSQHDLARNLQFDVTLRARSRDEALYHLPGVLLVDARLAWRPWRGGEVSLTGHNLADRRVMEGYPELSVVAIPLRRTFVLKWTQRF